MGTPPHTRVNSHIHKFSLIESESPSESHAFFLISQTPASELLDVAYMFGCSGIIEPTAQSDEGKGENSLVEACQRASNEYHARVCGILPSSEQGTDLSSVHVHKLKSRLSKGDVVAFLFLTPDQLDDEELLSMCDGLYHVFDKPVSSRGLSMALSPEAQASIVFHRLQW